MTVESTDLLILDRKKKRKHKATNMEINLTSMIDVLFMLMLFFLLGTRFGEHEGVLMSHLPQTTPGVPDKTEVPTPPIVIQLSEGPPNTLSYKLGQGDAVLYPAPGSGKDAENFDLVPVVKADKEHEAVYQIDDAKLFKHLVDMRGTVNLAKVTVKIVPGPGVQWNYCLQVLNTVVRAKYPEIRWSVPMQKKTG